MEGLKVHAKYIFIRNGRFQAGTETKPIMNNVEIILYGSKDDPFLPHYGNKVLALREGIMDLHGKVYSHTWSQLDSTAAVAATSIVIQDQVDWEVGQQIVIASTDVDHYQREERTIATITPNTPAGKTTITFTGGLMYAHLGVTETYGGQSFDFRAEVGLLTRKLKVRGDDTSEQNMYGAHIMTFSSTGNDSSVARISYTEVTQAGQAFNLGRYAIHYHLIGNVHKSYVLGNAIHHTYNRAVTIHGVHYLKIQNNVAYRVKGHAIFIEDGIETHNLIEDNLVMNVRSSESLLNTDQTPACFWITNPNNIWRRNHCAGSDRYGFWFDLRAHPEGPSATTSICPTGERLGEFTDNQAHSVGRYALRVFHEHIPRTFPCQSIRNNALADPFSENPPVEAVYQNFVGWRNLRDTVIGERLGAVVFRNIKSFDNKRAGIEISDSDYSPLGSLLIDNALLVGVTADQASNSAAYTAIRGIITPKKDNLKVQNVRFHNYGTGHTAIETCSHCEHPAATDSGGRVAYFKQLAFTSVTQKVRYNTP
jgi:hypothetical protein